MTPEQINNTLEKHILWLKNDPVGEKADFSHKDLRRVNLIFSDLKFADFIGANLREADLSRAYLEGTDLREADLSSAYLAGTDLRGANLSGVKGLLSPIDFLKSNFESTKDGYIAYKTFNCIYKVPRYWNIVAGNVIEETVNFDRCTECGSGINVAPLEWVKTYYPNEPIWKVLIRWEWLPGVCVPYESNGKIRCERVELLEVVK